MSDRPAVLHRYNGLYKLETGIPIPPLPGGKGGGGKRKGDKNKYPFAFMEIGDSFLVPKDDGVPACNVQAAAAKASARLQARFETRSIAEGVRVWRTA